MVEQAQHESGVPSRADALTAISQPARIADAGTGIGLDELRLAARNHGMPLEALRYEVTPAGLHYVLVHYDIPAINAADWSLRVDGAVRRPITLGIDDLDHRARRTLRVTLECAGNGRAKLLPRPVSQPWLDEAVGTADWAGVPLAPLLRDAEPLPEAVDVVFTGADHGVERGVEQDYQRGLPIAEALRDEALLADRMNGAPLPPQHGYPLRLIIPGWYGMAHVKWLRRITVLTRPFDGFQNAVAYRVKRSAADPGEPVRRIRPRALIVPPGFPDFMSRTRFVPPGEHLIEGRAWSGTGPVVRVEFSADSGASWQVAELSRPAEPWGWSSFRVRWLATPGRYELLVRAADDAGHVQPVHERWNTQGMANNMAQRVPVVVG